MRACPESGKSSPMIIRSVVGFPDPFGPRNPVTVPGRTVNDSRPAATAGPYRLARPRTSIFESVSRPARGARALGKSR
jgi:hypothetical protein